MQVQMSLKWKMVTGAMMVLVPMWIVLLLGLQSSFDHYDEQLFGAIEQRATVTARAFEKGVSGVSSGSSKNDAKAVLQEFLAKTNSKKTVSKTALHSISLLDKDMKTSIAVGNEIDLRQILAGIGKIDRVKVVRKGDLVVAVVKIQSGALNGTYLAYTEEQEDSRAGTFYVVNIVVLIQLLLVGYVLFRIGKMATKPISGLTETAKKIAAGDLTAFDEQQTHTLETANLAASFKAMGTTLQRQMSSIKSLTLELIESSGDFTSSMSKLTSSASEQAAAVTETAATVEEMEQAGRSAAGNARSIVDAAEKTTEASIRGREAVETTNGIILKIKEDSQDIVDKSRHLLSAVEEVGNIIRSVNAIAEQSKILAVNASIEAAKAGEYGSGFAVVAQEVKDLAQQSKDATLQITGTLTAIRQAIEMMVETSHSGEARTSEGVTTIANAGAIMNDLSEAIRENSEFANVIATNVNQQTVGLTQIATSIEQINSTAFENQNISKRNSEMASQMISTIGELNQLMGNWKISEDIGSIKEGTPTDAETEADSS